MTDLSKAHEINAEIELSVYGPLGSEQSTAASSWDTAKLLADAFKRIEQLEKQIASLKNLEPPTEWFASTNHIMTEQTHPMIPPTELLGQWEDDWFNEREHADVLLVNAYAAGALAGADQELEACCEWLQDLELNVDTRKLRAARRPNPLSLKEQALAILNDAHRGDLGDDEMATIRRALEQLPDNEPSGNSR